MQWIMHYLCLGLTSGLLSYSILYGNMTAGVIDETDHQFNLILCQSLISEKLKALENALPEEKAIKISNAIGMIGHELLIKGFRLSAYSYGLTPKKSPFIAAIPLWEGVNAEQALPLTLFIYAWPPETWAKACHSSLQNYATPIHSHPIPCAFTILHGCVKQELFAPLFDLKSPYAKCFKTEFLKPGTVVIDSNQGCFIHRMVCQSSGREAALSLHAYGAKTSQEVQHAFHQTASTHTYILNE